MPQLWDWLIHGGNIGVLLYAAWKLSRDESLKRDYPPHRHINGSKILYPQEYPPSAVERLNGAD